MFIKIYLIALTVFLGLDTIWLTVISKNFYKEQIGFLMKTDINWIAAIIFYLIFIIGIVFFVVIPGIQKDSIMYVILAGALFGLITYSTYDLTNLATMKNWPLIITIVDMVWGTILSSIVSVVSFYIAKKLGIH